MPREVVINSTTDVLADVQRAAGMEPTKDALADETARFEDKLAESEKRAAAESQAGFGAFEKLPYLARLN
jgi:hypothetical protein